jgi:acyl-CoA dehydrogenase
MMGARTQTTPPRPHSITSDSPAQRAAVIAAMVARPLADEVDRHARFPQQAVEEMRATRLLSAYVPRMFGGDGCRLSELAEAAEALARGCASTGMVFAMHQIQMACLVHHHHGSPSEFFRDYLAEVCARQSLLASATTEVGVGGDVRTSLCAIEPQGATFTLAKQASVISYGAYADGILVTARRAPDADRHDQVLALVRRDDYTLEPTEAWDTLGMRGTCSPGFRLAASGAIDQILPAPYADISAQTMLPVSHLLWSAVWLGIANDAIAKARRFVQAEGRRRSGATPPGALRLAEAMTALQTMRATVEDALREYERLMPDQEALGRVGFALRMNTLKVVTASLVTDIVARALAICGIAGYRTDSEYSLGRHLRDAYSAGLMIANDRILGVNASLLLVHREP